MGRFFNYLLFFSFISFYAQSQTIPVSLDSSIVISKLIDVSSGTPVRIDKDPITGELYYTTLPGFIYKIVQPENSPAYDTLMFTSAQHMITSMQGMCFYDSSMFLTGNRPLDGNNMRSAVIMRGKLGVNSNRNWTKVAETELFEGAAFFDHLITSIIATPNGDSLLISSGSRGDHGEVQDFNGQFPGMRLIPLSCKILTIPAYGSNIIIPNDSIALDSLNFVFADGFRNNFDMAYNAKGELFGTENAGDRDMDEELNWIRRGHHYGFPWYMGNDLNPSQFASYDPAADLLINHNSYAWVNGFFTIDTTFPPQPAGITFTSPCANEGPDADIFRDTLTGSLIDATTLGSSKYVYSFTGHRSPLGLTFDKDSLLAGIYNGGAFVCSWTRGDSTLNGYSDLMAGMNDHSEDLLFLEMRKNASNDNYIFSANKVVEDLKHPVDAVLSGNRMYILETGAAPGPAIWEVTFPLRCNSDTLSLTISSSSKNLSCNTSNDGRAKISVNGGIPPYEYSWNTNPVTTTGSIQNVNGGVYYATVTDSRGCTASTSITINQPDPLSVIQIPTNTNPSGTATGSIDQIPSGGINPYTFQWSNGSIAEDASNLLPGLYYCHVIDKNGCAVLVSITIN